jgi:malonate decarboxylase epsilon subunit
MSLAFLYPGQGSQRPDMLRALPASPAVTRTLDEAALELDHTRWLAGLDDLDTAEALQSTTNVQLALPEVPPCRWGLSRNRLCEQVFL